MKKSWNHFTKSVYILYKQNGCAHNHCAFKRTPFSLNSQSRNQPISGYFPTLFTILGIIWKTQGQLYWLKLELAKSQNLENCQQSILEKPLNIVFEKVLETRVNAVKNQSVGAPVIYNLKKNWCVARRKIAKISWNWPHRPW